MPYSQRSLRPTPVAWLLLFAPAAACGGGASSPETVHDSGVDTRGPGLIIDFDASDATKGDDTGKPPPDAGTPDATQVVPTLTAVPLVSCVPSEYTAAVTLGGSQTFQMAIDTGSTTLGVASTMCTSCGVSPEYSPGTTATDEHSQQTSQYGTGSWTGEVYQDTVRAGMSGTTPDKLVAIDTQSQFFQAGVQCGTAAGPQGILGLGPAGSALPGTQGFFDALVANDHVPNVFATQLCDGSGTLWLGGYDPTFTTAAPQYTPLSAGVAQYYYAVTLSSITVGGTSIPVAAGEFTDSIVDTGTSVFILGTSAYTALTNLIGANAAFDQLFGFAAPPTPDAGETDGGSTDASAAPSPGASWFANPNNCVHLSQTKAELDAMLPPLTLVFGSNPGIEVQAAPTESYLITYDGLWCPALLSEPQGQDFPLAAILGSPVLRSNVVIFDRANSRIGFAPHKTCP